MGKVIKNTSKLTVYVGFNFIFSIFVML